MNTLFDLLKDFNIPIISNVESVLHIHERDIHNLIHYGIIEKFHPTNYSLTLNKDNCMALFELDNPSDSDEIAKQITHIINKFEKN